MGSNFRERTGSRVGFHPSRWRETPSPAPERAVRQEGLYSLNLRRIARYPFRAGPIYFLVLFYVFLEYVRPQTIYPVLNFLPWAQVALVLAGLSLLLSGKAVRDLFLLDYLLIAFTGVVIASSFAAYRPAASFHDLGDRFLAWVLVYWLISTTVKSESRFIVFTLAYFLWNLKMSQHAARSFVLVGGGFQSWGATGAPGWFQNSGEMAIQMCIFLPMSWYFWVGLRRNLNRWKSLVLLALPMSAGVAIIASSSRGGQLGAAAVILAMILKSKHRLRGLLWGSLAAVIGFFLLPQEQLDRFSEMGTDETSMSRRIYWSDALEIMQDYPVFGIGYANWIPYYRNFYNEGGELPHNVFLEAGAELGYVGLLAFLALIVGTFIVNRRTRRLAADLPGPSKDLLTAMAHGLDVALIGFMVSGFFVTVLYYPFFWFNLAFTSALFLSTKNKASARPRALRAQRTLQAPMDQPAYPVGSA